MVTREKCTVKGLRSKTRSNSECTVDITCYCLDYLLKLANRLHLLINPAFGAEGCPILSSTWRFVLVPGKQWQGLQAPAPRHAALLLYTPRVSLPFHLILKSAGSREPCRTALTLRNSDQVHHHTCICCQCRTSGRVRGEAS